MTKFPLAGAVLALMLLAAGCGEQSSGQTQAAAPAAPAPPTNDTSLPDPLRMATEGSYPPLAFFNPAGQLEGFEIDVTNALCARMQLRCEILPQTWEGLLPSLQAGRYDALIAGMTITEERRQAVDFTEPYAVSAAVMVTLKDSPLQQLQVGLSQVGLDEIDAAERQALETIRTALAGKTIGVQVATSHIAFLNEYFGDGISIRQYDTQDNLVLDLTTGRIDAGIADDVAWVTFLQSPQGKDAALAGPRFAGGLYGAGLGIAVRKGRPDLLAALNGALADVKQDGTLKALSEKWLGFDAASP